MGRGWSLSPIEGVPGGYVLLGQHYSVGVYSEHSTYWGEE